MNDRPLVSIGFPLYNGMRYLRGALDCLMAQDYPNIELVISDNGSTDGSFDACAEYVGRGMNIRLFRSQENIGAAQNFMRVRELATGTYFMWAAHDDLLEPSFVSTAVRGLEEHPEAVLAFSNVRFIDPAGVVIPNVSYNKVDSLGHDIFDRARVLMQKAGWYAIYGLMRLEHARQLPFYTVFGVDVLQLMWLSLRGSFVIDPRELFVYRIRNKSPQDDLNAISKPGEVAVARRPYTSLACNLLQVIGLAKADLATTVGLKSALLNMFSFKGGHWMQAILGENPEVVEYVKARHPEGFKSETLLGLFAGLLLDRADLPTFELAPDRNISTLEADLSTALRLETFVDRIVGFIEKGHLVEALAYYDEHKLRFEQRVELAPIAAQLEQLRARTPARA